MLVCNYCGTVIDERDLKTRTQIHDYTDLQPLKETIVDYDCEHCGKGEYVKAAECKVCGTWFNDEAGLGVCDCCLENAETFENAVKLGREDTKDIEINGFLASLFSTEKINDIIEQYAEQHFTDHCSEISAYFWKNKTYLAEMIIEESAEVK